MLPNVVAKAYNFPQGRSLQNYTVAVIQLGGSYNPQDILNYCDKHGYIRPNLFIETVDDAKPTYTGARGADGEVCLDTCIIAAVAQGVNIINFFAPNSEEGFAHAIEAALDHHAQPSVISISWGAPANRWTAQGRAMVDSALKKADAVGVPVFVASGDNGSKDGTSGPVVDFPSSSPWAIGCGGTRLALNEDGTRLSEKAWSHQDGNGSTGGGISEYYERPEYQEKAHDFAFRTVPDVSGNADPITGYDIVADGTSMKVGGTSAVAPLYAALWAIICSRVGIQRIDASLNHVLYNNPVTIDVVGGENDDYQCTTNYDLCTGLGVINGEALLEIVALGEGVQVLPALPATPGTIVPTNPQVKKSWLSKLLSVLKIKKNVNLNATRHSYILYQEDVCKCRK